MHARVSARGETSAPFAVQIEYVPVSGVGTEPGPACCTAMQIFEVQQFPRGAIDVRLSLKFSNKVNPPKNSLKTLDSDRWTFRGYT